MYRWHKLNNSTWCVRSICENAIGDIVGVKALSGRITIVKLTSRIKTTKDDLILYEFEKFLEHHEYDDCDVSLDDTF